MSKEVNSTLMSGGSVGSNGSTTTDEQSLSGGDLTGTVSYHMTGDGTPEARFQIADGVDANGADIWVTIATKADLEGAFDIGTTRSKKCRLEIVETSGGTAVSLDAIHVFTNPASRGSQETPAVGALGNSTGTSTESGDSGGILF